MKAFVLVRVGAKTSGGVVELLRKTEGVVEAWAVYGGEDVVAKVEVADVNSLDNLIMQRIQGIPLVESTRTFIVVDGI